MPICQFHSPHPKSPAYLHNTHRCLVRAVVALCLLMGSVIVQKPTFMRQAAADRLSSLRQAAADVVQSRSSCQQVDASNTQELIISEACQQRRMALCLEDSQADSEITAYSAKSFKSGRKPRCVRTTGHLFAC